MFDIMTGRGGGRDTAKDDTRQTARWAAGWAQAKLIDIENEEDFEVHEKMGLGQNYPASYWQNQAHYLLPHQLGSMGKWTGEI